MNESGKILNALLDAALAPSGQGQDALPAYSYNAALPSRVMAALIEAAAPSRDELSTLRAADKRFRELAELEIKFGYDRAVSHWESLVANCEISEKRLAELPGLAEVQARFQSARNAVNLGQMKVVQTAAPVAAKILDRLALAAGKRFQALDAEEREACAAAGQSFRASLLLSGLRAARRNFTHSAEQLRSGSCHTSPSAMVPGLVL